VKLAVEVATSEKVAIKTIRKKKVGNPEDLDRIRREIKIMSSLEHPHIVNIREGELPFLSQWFYILFPVFRIQELFFRASMRNVDVV